MAKRKSNLNKEVKKDIPNVEEEVQEVPEEEVQEVKLEEEVDDITIEEEVQEVTEEEVDDVILEENAKEKIKIIKNVKFNKDVYKIGNEVLLSKQEAEELINLGYAKK